jgi:formylglycine-generating enzyme required for sulfatase activity
LNAQFEEPLLKPEDNLWFFFAWHNDYKRAPTDGSAWIDIDRTENDNHSRLLRGGSWNDDPGNCRSAFRDFDDPDGRYDYFGFRVVVSAART